MRTEEPQVAVCIVRVERQRHGGLISVQRVPDVEGRTTAPWEPAPDVEAAVWMVRAFLEQALLTTGA